VELHELLLTRREGATPQAVAALESKLGHTLPADIRAFLLVSDGSEWATFSALAIQVLSVEQIGDLHALAPDHRTGSASLIDLANDGGRERFCRDPRCDTIVWLDITAEQDPVVCAATLTELIRRSRAAPGIHDPALQPSQLISDAS